MKKEKFIQIQKGSNSELVGILESRSFSQQILILRLLKKYNVNYVHLRNLKQDIKLSKNTVIFKEFLKLGLEQTLDLDQLIILMLNYKHIYIRKEQYLELDNFNTWKQNFSKDKKILEIFFGKCPTP